VKGKGGTKNADKSPAEQLDQYFTPEWLARKLVSFAELHRRDRVLEPSCGDGGILRCLPRNVTIEAWEIDPEQVIKAIDAAGAAELQATIRTGDFLDAELGTFDVAIMNPPFTGAEKHIARALSVAKRVIALVPLATLATVGRREVLWDRCVVTKIAVIDGRPRFGGPADKGTPGQRDMMAIEVWPGEGEREPGERDAVDLEWWRVPRKGDA
jgi:hypothetical protein